jgi:hypothetical protein
MRWLLEDGWREQVPRIDNQLAGPRSSHATMAVQSIPALSFVYLNHCDINRLQAKRSVAVALALLRACAWHAYWLVWMRWQIGR